MPRTIDTTRTAHRILALRRTARRGGDVRDELEPIIEGLRGDLDDTMSKSQAAKVIGVSVPTLDKWIEQRIVPVTAQRVGDREFRGTPRSTSPSELPIFESAGVNGTSSLPLLTSCSETTLPTNANSRSSTAYGPGLRALASEELVSAAPTAEFGPRISGRSWAA